MITNTQSGTTVNEIADRIYRISTPVHVLGGFTFNQYLIADEEPLLFHTGPRRMFPLVREAIARVIQSSGSAISGFLTLKPMKAALLTSSLRWRHGRCRCAA